MECTSTNRPCSVPKLVSLLGGGGFGIESPTGVLEIMEFDIMADRMELEREKLAPVTDAFGTELD